MSSPRVDRAPAPRAFRTAELAAAGWSWRQLAAAVEARGLVRLRAGSYCSADAPAECIAAGQMRGRLTCVSELRRRGVFVRDRSPLQVHVPATAARLGAVPAGVRVHRGALHRAPHPQSMSVEPFDALACAVRCQDPRAAIATLDSALHHGLLRLDELDELFAALPRRYRRLRRLLDPRAESGPESILRLMLRALGRRFEVQVQIDDVGRVDFVVDGWLIVECDSRQFHSTWEAQLEDRRRDLAAAARGYLTIRFVAEDILWRPEIVLAALRGVLDRVVRVAAAG